MPVMENQRGTQDSMPVMENQQVPGQGLISPLIAQIKRIFADP
jgi:hypothetical protein